MTQLTVDAIELHALEMPLVGDFATSFARVRTREMLIVEVRTKSGLVGWGEAPVASRPHYSSETRKTALHVLEDWLAPALVGRSFASLGDVRSQLALFSLTTPGHGALTLPSGRCPSPRSETAFPDHYLGRLTPYLDRPLRRPSTPEASAAPRTTW